MSINLIKSLIKYAVLCVSFFIFLYLLVFVNENGFEYSWALPLSFCFCFPFLNRAIQNNKLLLFFPAFMVVAFLRYVVNPFLLCYTNDYFGRIMTAHPSVDSLYMATYLMVYELVVCTMFIYFLSKKYSFGYDKMPQLCLPRSYVIYVIFVFLAVIFFLMNPKIIYFFSFGIWGMEEFDISILNPMAQVAIMLTITAKFVLFWILLSVVKLKHDVSKYPFIWKFFGFIVTLVFGFIYYGGNRAQFLFSLITSFYIFILFFPNLKKTVIIIAVVLGMIVLSFMTDQRGYYDYYSHEKGVKKSALKYAQITTSYFGGITNVAIGVDMVTKYSYKNKGLQLFKDLLLPIVGLNKLIPFEDKELSNTLFNYVFFNSKKNISQILPSIAHGYFLGGLVFCVILDIVQLLFVFYLIIQLRKTRRMELVFIFNVVLFRFSIMFGQNITQQINGIVMQLALPMVVYWLNNRFCLVKKQ